jgi:hypothetical protein
MGRGHSETVYWWQLGCARAPNFAVSPFKTPSAVQPGHLAQEIRNSITTFVCAAGSPPYETGNWQHRIVRGNDYGDARPH